MKVEWLKELTKEEIEKALEGDLELIYSLCGLNVLMALWEHFSGMNIYVSTKPLRSLQRLYIKKNFTGENIKELAQKLGVSEKFVYIVISNDRN